MGNTKRVDNDTLCVVLPDVLCLLLGDIPKRGEKWDAVQKERFISAFLAVLDHLYPSEITGGFSYFGRKDKSTEKLFDGLRSQKTKEEKERVRPYMMSRFIDDAQKRLRDNGDLPVWIETISDNAEDNTYTSLPLRSLGVKMPSALVQYFPQHLAAFVLQGY